MYVWVGTIAELIKLWPVIKDLREQGLRPRIIATGQNPIEQCGFWEQVVPYLSQPVIVLGKGPRKKSILSLFTWFFTLLFVAPYRLSAFRGRSRVLVHGDTLSTLIGAWTGRVLGWRVYHVEAGLRSGHWANPFPEELCRRFVSRLADVALCPNDWAVNNLGRYRRLRKVNTQGNTLRDSLRLVSELPSSLFTAKEPYFVATLHRQELLMQPKLFEQVLRSIQENAPLHWYFILHAPAEKCLNRLPDFRRELSQDSHLTLLPRLPYTDFMQLLKNAEFLITDGGSNQEEAYYMGLPCLILRPRTERIEGLGETAHLNGYDKQGIRKFMQEYRKYRLKPLERESQSPSFIVASQFVPPLATT